MRRPIFAVALLAAACTSGGGDNTGQPLNADAGMTRDIDSGGGIGGGGGGGNSPDTGGGMIGGSGGDSFGGTGGDSGGAGGAGGQAGGAGGQVGGAGGSDDDPRHPGACEVLSVRTADGSIRDRRLLHWSGRDLMSVTYDDFDDGTINRRESYGYDDEGRETRHEVDYGDDGRSDQIDTRQYEGDRLVRREFDSDANGVVDTVWDITYEADPEREDHTIERYVTRAVVGNAVIDGREDVVNPEGDVVETRLDLDGDGEFEVRQLYTKVRDGDTITTDFDIDGDGEIDMRRVDRTEGDPDDEIIETEFRALRTIATSTEGWTYDERGNRIGHTADNNGDGEPDLIEEFTFDDNDNLTHSEHDQDGDGRPERADDNIYDDEGRLVRIEIDLSADNSVEAVIVLSYDDEGRVTEQSWENTDGFAFARTTMTYDDNGNLIVQERVGLPDPQWNQYEGFAFDDQDRITRYELDENGDGQFERIVLVEYDDDGNIARRIFDDNGDGAHDLIEINHVDGAGNTIAISFDFAADDSIESRVYRFFDDNGHILRDYIDRNNDGSVDLGSLRTYDAEGRPLEIINSPSEGIDRIHHYTYTPIGNLESLTTDVFADGADDQGHTLDYACWE